MGFREPDTSTHALEELIGWDQWVLFRIETRNGTPTKTPISARAGVERASVTDPSTWTAYARALEVGKRREDVAGLGWVVTKETGILLVDLDKCLDPETKQPDERAAEIVRRLNSYTEISPSGTGLHIFVKGAIPKASRHGGLEVYDHKRFFTVTGEWFESSPDEIVENQEGVDWLWRTHFEPWQVGQGLPGEQPQLNGVKPGELNPARWEAAIEGDPTFKRTHEHKRPDLPDRTQSGYDMAMAIQMAMLGWEPEEIAAGVIYHRLQWKDPQGKTRRQDYIDRTVSRAINWVSRGGSDKNLGEMATEEDREAATTGGDTARDLIFRRLGVRVDRIEQLGEDDPAYFLFLDGGQEVRIGTADQFTSQAAVAKHIYIATRRMPNDLKRPQWKTVLQAFGSLIVVKEREALSWKSGIAGHVQAYLDANPPLVLEDGAASSETRSSMALSGKPFIFEKELWLYPPNVHRYFALTGQDTKGEAELKRFLASVGFISHAIAAGRGEEKRKAHTTRRYWFGPPDAIHPDLGVRPPDGPAPPQARAPEPVETADAPF